MSEVQKESEKRTLNNPDWVQIDSRKLVAADWNYKENDEAQEQKLIANIKRNGQVENLLIRRLKTGFYEVVNGNHRLAAFRRLSMNPIVCYDLGNISDAQARRIAIETNETKFASNDAALGLLIREIAEDHGGEFAMDDLVTTMPFTEDTLSAYGEMADFDWDGFQELSDKELAVLAEKRKEKSQTLDLLVTCPECSHRFKLDSVEGK